MSEFEITAIAIASAFVYGIGIGRAYRWSQPKWGTAEESPATFFASALWPCIALWFVLRLPIALGFRIGARKPAELPKAQVRK